MNRLAFLGIILLASSALALPPAATVTHALGRTTITVSYDAADIAEPPPPLLPVAAWVGGEHPVLLTLPVPGTLDTEHGSVPLLDPTSGVIRVVAAGMARRAIRSGQPAPVMVDGIRAKIRDKLRDEYSGAVSDWMYLQRSNSTPAAVVDGLVADTPGQ